MYIDQYNLKETTGLARFSLGTWKLEVKEEVQKKWTMPHIYRRRKSISFSIIT